MVSAAFNALLSPCLNAAYHSSEGSASAAPCPLVVYRGSGAAHREAGGDEATITREVRIRCSACGPDIVLSGTSVYAAAHGAASRRPIR